MPFQGKPIIGIVGGIGSGKSFVARMLAESFGCAVIDSDAVAHTVYADPDVIDALRSHFGDEVLDPSGRVDRRFLAARIFRDPAERQWLESLIHPRIHARREADMIRLAADPAVRAFVWDSPLLIEAGLHAQCDAVLFVDTPYAQRLQRVQASRGWDKNELDRREAAQVSLDEKRRLSRIIVRGDEDRSAIIAALQESLVKAFPDHWNAADFASLRDSV